MKSFAAVLASTATAQNMFLQDQVASLFRPTSDANSVIDLAKIVAEWKETEFLTDYEAQANYIKNVTKTIKSQKNSESNDQPIYTCATR